MIITKMTRIIAIAAVSKNNGIGYNNKIPWSCKEDMLWFRTITSETKTNQPNVLIMGRKTFESFNQKPLKNRINVVLTRESSPTDLPDEGLYIRNDLPLAIHEWSIDHDVFIIGGSEIYREVITKPVCETLYITHMKSSHECDVFFPDIPGKYYSIERVIKDTPEFTILEYKRAPIGISLGMPAIPFNEGQYQDLLNGLVNDLVNDLSKGESIFGRQMRFLLDSSFPLFSMIPVDWSTVVEETLSLMRFGVGNQLTDLVQRIKDKPTDRRIILNYHTPTDEFSDSIDSQMIISQFYYDGKGLSCSVYFCSGHVDVDRCTISRGVASAALITNIVAKLTDLTPHELTVTIGLISADHGSLVLSKNKTPRPFPILKVNDQKTYAHIHDFEPSDFTLFGYFPHLEK